MSKKKKQLPLPLYDELVALDQNIFNEEGAWHTPDYITENIVHTFRYYQNAALRFFITHKLPRSFVIARSIMFYLIWQQAVEKQT